MTQSGEIASSHFTQQRARQLQVVSQVSQSVTATLELDELLAQVVKLIRRTFGYYHVSVFLLDMDSLALVMRQFSSQNDVSTETKEVRLEKGQGIVGKVAGTGKPFLCNDVRQEPSYSPHELLPETQAELAVPLKTGNRVIGVLDVQSRNVDSFQEDDIIVLQILGDQIAIAIENARLFQDARRQYEAMHALHGIALELTSQLESGGVVAIILQNATRLLGAQGSVLGVYDSPADLVRVIAVHNVPDELKNAELRPGEGVGSLVIATGQPVVVNDLPRWEKRAPVFNKMNLPYDAILSVPLRWQGELFGALSLVDRGERRPFTNDDVQLLSLFADLASIALKKADLYFEITQLSQDLERKVAERTEELGLARDELAQKAEQLQQLLANMIHIQEEERTRIALDLHDESNQLITAALYEIQAGQESIRGERHAAALGKLETAKELLRRLETENRRIITGLRPPMLDSQGLIATLKWHAEAFQEHSHIPCRVQVYGRPIRLSSPTVETAVYRVVQESLNNVAAHAQARNVSLLVQFGPEELRLIIEDDGVGFDYDRTVSHTSSQMGLIGIRERVQSIGGHIDIFSTPGGGTRIALKIPVNDHSVTLERDEHYFRTRS